MLSSGAAVLAIDASTPTSVVVVGLWGSPTPASVDARIDGAYQASVDLHTRIEAALASAGVHPTAIAAVGCGIGPGTFTGTRVAASTAMGIAYGLGCPLVAIPSLLSVAASSRAAGAFDRVDPPDREDRQVRGRTLLAVIDARRGDLYGAAVTAAPPAAHAPRFDRAARQCGRTWTAAPAVCAPWATLKARWPDARAVVGPGVHAAIAATASRLGISEGEAHAVLASEFDVVEDLDGMTPEGLWLATCASADDPGRVGPPRALDLDYLRATYAELGVHAPKRARFTSPFCR